MPENDVLTERELNRTLLQRQGLIDRWDLGVIEAVERLAGMQSQEPLSTHLGLWTRVNGFSPAALNDALQERKLVRGTLMRGTVHLVSVADFQVWRTTLAAALRDRMRPRNSATIDDALLDAVRAQALQELSDGPLPAAELSRRLEAAMGAVPDQVRPAVITAVIPLVQMLPRGLLGSTQPKPVLEPFERYINGTLAKYADPQGMIERYLAAFGPATLADMRAWSGLADLRRQLDVDAFRQYRNEAGRVLYDVPDGEIAAADTRVPVRLLPEFDNVLLSHADRSRIIPPLAKQRLASKNGMLPATFLVDGKVRGSFRYRSTGRSARAVFTPFEPVSKRDQASLAAEAKRLLRCFYPDRSAYKIDFAA